jgi:N-acetylglutamate synthase-like GNAT family acetyltransferase
MSTTSPSDHSPEVTVTHMATSAEARKFKELNEQWIVDLFTLEPKDEMLLDDPQGTMVEPGGRVLIARTNGDVVGCVALLAAGDGVFELSKMAVSPTLRGHGVGRAILLAAINAAKDAGAASLFLVTNTKLANAVYLYESVGFRHVPPETLGPVPYKRADAFMEYRLR